MKADRWEQVAEKCLDSALALLEKETTPTIETVEAVRGLAKTAIAVSKVIGNEFNLCVIALVKTTKTA